jgi:hypothetical protein
MIKNTTAQRVYPPNVPYMTSTPLMFDMIQIMFAEALSAIDTCHTYTAHFLSKELGRFAGRMRDKHTGIKKEASQFAAIGYEPDSPLLYKTVGTTWVGRNRY